MTATPTTASTRTPPRSRRKAAALANLLRKEIRESRPVIIVGLWTFWLMPAVLELTYVNFDWRGELLPGFAWVLLAVAGWFFAIVVAAHGVCRDWGKPQEHFLLSRPVSPAQVVLAKFIANAAVIALIFAIAALWDVFIYYEAAKSRVGAELADLAEMMPLAALLLCIIACGYAFAFVAAVITRQTLTSILMAVLVLLTWITAPLLSSRLTFLHPRSIWQGMVERSADVMVNFDLVFIGIVALAIVVCFAAALIAAARQQVMNLGPKHLAWTIVIVVLLLFTLAMGEVGNSLTMRSRVDLLTGGEPGGIRNYIYFSEAVRADDRFFVGFSAYAHDRDRRSTHAVHVTGFQVGPKGDVRNLQRIDLLETTKTSISSILSLTTEIDDRVVVTTRIHESASNTVDQLYQAWVSWPVEGEPELVKEQTIAMPATQDWGYWSINSYTIIGQNAYLNYHHSPDNRKTEFPLEPVICIFDLDPEQGPQLKHKIQLPMPVFLSRSGDNLLVMWMHKRRWKLSAFNPDDLDILLDPDRWPEKAVPRPRDPSFVDDFVNRLGHEAGYVPALAAAQAAVGTRSGWGALVQTQDALWDRSRQLAFLTDRLGLRVAGKSESEKWQIIGEYRASPLAMMRAAVRDDDDAAQLILFDNALLIETGDDNITAYDVSDPQRPRKVGFAAYKNYWYQPLVEATDRHLVVIDQQTVTVFDRPATGRAR